MESLGDVDRDVVDAILHGALAKGGKHFRHLAAVGVGDLVGLELKLAVGLEVDEEVRTGVVVEVHLVSHVIGMENDDFVLVMAEVPQSVEEGFLGF